MMANPMISIHIARLLKRCDFILFHIIPVYNLSMEQPVWEFQNPINSERIEHQTRVWILH